MPTDNLMPTEAERYAELREALDRVSLQLETVSQLQDRLRAQMIAIWGMMVSLEASRPGAFARSADGETWCPGNIVPFRPGDRA
jgi:hypothetical protein